MMEKQTPTAVPLWAIPAMDRLVPVSFKDENPIWQNREDEEAKKNGLR